MTQPRAKTSGIWTKSRRIFPWIQFQPGETTFAQGLACLVVTVVLTHVVMGWFLAVVTAPLTILAIIRGIGAARAPGRITGRQWAGAGLLLLGMPILGLMAFTAASLSTQLALAGKGHTIAAENFSIMSSGILSWSLVTSLVPAIILSSGLPFWTNWPQRRRRIWTVIFLTIPLITFALHQILAAIGAPLTA